MKVVINTLKGQIISIILAISVFTTLIGLILLYSFDMPKRSEELIHNSNIQLSIFSENISYFIKELDTTNLNKAIKSYTRYSHIVKISIIDHKDDTIKTFLKPAIKNLKKDDLIIITKKINLNNKNLGIIKTYISKKSLYDRSIDYIVTSIIIVSLTIAISLILGFKLEPIISNPIIKLSQIAKQISSTNEYNVEIVNKSNIETSVLYDEFNKMINTIKLRENEISSARKFLTDVLNAMPSSLITVNSDFKIISSNNAAQKLSAVNQDALLNCPINIAFPLFQDQFAEISSIQKSRKSKVIRKIEKNINGKKCYFDVGFYPLSNIEGIVIRMDDVTQQINFENLMLQTEKMMSVGGLAAGMAHEINNPLGVIIQTTQNIERRISPELNSNINTAKDIGISIEDIFKYVKNREIPSFINDIKKSCTRASEIVKNMLEFSHKSDSIKKPVDIISIINNSINLASNDFNLKKKYDFKDVEIVKEYNLENPSILAVETELEQVFLNLLKNSVQAMSEIQRKSRIIIRVYKNRSMVRIELEDNGPGIDKSVQNHLFEPFFTTKPIGEGTGLGLSVSYMIITTNHNGFIDIESHAGNGTKFIIDLPQEE